MRKVAELGPNIAVIVIAGFLSEFLMHRYIFAPHAPTVASSAPISSAQAEIPDHIDWATGSRTLILALQTNCGFCNASASFYKRLIERSASQNIRLVAALPSDVKTSTDHLNELGLSGLEVRSMPLGSIHVNGTPTLLLVNEKREVTDQWVGKLPPEREAEVIQKVTSGS